MPIGIPAPPFGLKEQAPAAPAPWDSSHTSAGGYQFYYVCPTCSGHTDSSNPYGTPAKPRDTVPNTLPSGSVVEVHGQVDTDESFTANGTAALPVFVRGDGNLPRPELTVKLKVSGSYVILENLHFGPANAADGDFGVRIAEGNDHIAIRHCEASGNDQREGGIAVGTWTYGGSQSASYVVVSDCEVHNLGVVQAGVDTDAHGLTLNGAVDHFWLLDSELYKNTGDGIQIEAQHGNMAKINHIYLGRNKSHGNKQTGMWVKHATDVVISENELYDHRTIDQFSAGQCTGFQTNPERVWYLYNRIHDCDIGIAVASDDGPNEGKNSYFIGNVIHNVHAATTNPYDSGGITIRGGVNHYIVNNTIYDVDSGINMPPGGGHYEIVNNVIANRASGAGNDLYMESSSEAQDAVVEANEFFSGAGLRVNWGGSNYTSLGAFTKCQSCKDADPLFAGVSSGDFRLKPGSPAIDAGAVHAVYDEFKKRYGIDISVDPDRTPRPQGTAWDIGAYEAK